MPVRVERDGPVAGIVLDRPGSANALDFGLLAALVAAIEDQVADGARAIVVSGAEGRFSAGADFDALEGDASDIAFDDAVAAVGRAVAAAPVPVIAAIESYAFGAGVDLAWSCDAVVLASDARVAVPAVELGLLYNPESLVFLHARIGDRAWRRLLLLGDELDGATAFALGMGEVLSEPGQAVADAHRLAREVTGRSPGAVAATKSFGRAIIEGSSGRPEWEERRRELLAGADRRAAIAQRRRKRT